MVDSNLCFICTCSVFMAAMELICPGIWFMLPRFMLLLLLYIPPLACVEYCDWDCWGYTLEGGTVSQRACKIIFTKSRSHPRVRVTCCWWRCWRIGAIRWGQCSPGSPVHLPGLDPGDGFGPGSAAAWGFDPAAPSWGTAAGSAGSQPHMKNLTPGPGVAAAGSFLQIGADTKKGNELLWW